MSEGPQRSWLSGMVDVYECGCGMAEARVWHGLGHIGHCVVCGGPLYFARTEDATIWAAVFDPATGDDAA
jgi:hypothetical protein